MTRLILKPLLFISSTLYLAMILNWDRSSDSLIRFGAHSLLLAIMFLGLFLALRRRPILRASVLILLALEALIQLEYKSSLSVSMWASIFNTPANVSGNFLIYHGLSILSLTIISFTIFFSTPTAERLTIKGLNYVPALLVFGLSYLVLPTMFSYEQYTDKENYHLYRQMGSVKGLSNTAITIEFISEDIGRRFKPLTSMLGIMNIINFKTQTDTESSWENVENMAPDSNVLILGIGESLRRDNLALYGYDRNTTPYLSTQQENLSVYQHAYSGGTNTWSSLPAILTLTKDKPDLSKSIIHLANEAGYTTHWLTNHAEYNSWGFSVPAIANQADHTYFVSEQKAGSQFDEVLIEKANQILVNRNLDEKTLIVLHFFGSHMNFKDRYPSEYGIFTGAEQRLNEYDNSILYFDYVQQLAIGMASEYQAKYLFFADHGLGDPTGDIPLLHDVRATPSVSSLHVPLFEFTNEEALLNPNKMVSLFYFECLFARWANINASDLQDSEHCQQAMSQKKGLFVDANLQQHSIMPVISFNQRKNVNAL